MKVKRNNYWKTKRVLVSHTWTNIIMKGATSLYAGSLLSGECAIFSFHSRVISLRDIPAGLESTLLNTQGINN